MRLFLLLLLSCGLSSLFAQANTPEDPILEKYEPIYRAYQKKLTELGYPVGRAGNAAYVVDQYSLQYEGPNAEVDFRADLDALRLRFGRQRVQVIGECGCSDEFRIYNIEVTGIGGEERGKSGRDKIASTVGQEEVEPNYYLLPELEQLKDNPPFNQLPPNFVVVPPNNPNPEVVVAVLDTGLDPYFQHPQVTGGRAPLYLWENPAPNSTTDPFCLDDDLFGWDFINDDNAPVDDHSHGTHVASRIATQLLTNAPAVNYRFMSVKMLDHDGVGTTFHAACAVAYAALNGADVINASWGFYGESDRNLRKAFELAEANGVATMTSAGNFRRDVADVAHFPSGYSMQPAPLKSILFLSAARSFTQLWPRTNFRVWPQAPASHFVASPGANLLGFFPNYFGLPGNLGRKSGTSVATPYASALAAQHVHLYPGTTPETLRNNILAAIETQGTPSTVNYNGQAVPFRVFNWVNL